MELATNASIAVKVLVVRNTGRREEQSRGLSRPLALSFFPVHELDFGITFLVA